MKSALNLEVSDEVNIGVNAHHDTKTFKEVWPQMVYCPTDQKGCFYWLRADMTRSMAMAGCNQVVKEGYTHSFEAIYGWATGFKGFWGQPVEMRGGVEYELSDSSSLECGWSVGEKYSVGMEGTHQINKNLSVSATQSFDQENCGKNQPAYHIGFGAVYKL